MIGLDAYFSYLFVYAPFPPSKESCSYSGQRDLLLLNFLQRERQHWWVAVNNCCNFAFYSRVEFQVLLTKISLISVLLLSSPQNAHMRWADKSSDMFIWSALNYCCALATISLKGYSTNVTLEVQFTRHEDDLLLGFWPFFSNLSLASFPTLWKNNIKSL